MDLRSMQAAGLPKDDRFKGFRPLRNHHQ